MASADGCLRALRGHAQETHIHGKTGAVVATGRRET